MWEVSQNYYCGYGKYVYRVYKIRSQNNIDHAGNRLYDGHIYLTRAAAQARADELNKIKK